MLRKILSTLVAFLLFGAAGQVFADAAAELEHAESYHRIWNYQPAEAGYKAVYEKYPGTEYALDAYKKLVHMYIEWGKDQQADAALQRMLADFADRPDDVAAAVLYIAYESIWSGKYENGRELFQYILDNHSQSEYAFSAQVGLVISNIWLGQVEVADAALEQLMTQYSEKENIAEAARDIAHEYLEKDNFEKSFGLYQYIVDNHPQSEHAMWAQVGVVMSNIGLGDDAAAQAGIDSLIADFKGHPDFPAAISQIEEQYHMRILENEPPYSEDYHRIPVEVWEKAMNARPDFFYEDPDLYYFIACCYYQLGGYESAIEYYTIVLDNWPDYRQAFGAERLIEKCFEQLTNAGG